MRILNDICHHSAVDQGVVIGAGLLERAPQDSDPLASLFRQRVSNDEVDVRSIVDSVAKADLSLERVVQAEHGTVVELGVALAPLVDLSVELAVGLDERLYDTDAVVAGVCEGVANGALLVHEMLEDLEADLEG